MKQLSIEVYSEVFKRDIIELILHIQQNEFGIPITRSDQPDLENIPAVYQSGKGNFWLAKYNDRLIGTIALLDTGNGRGALRKMFVQKEFRGKEFQVGQQLLDTLLQWATAVNLEEVLLGTTEKFIAAQKFYEKNGFMEIDRHKLPEEFPVMAVDVKFYKRLITP